MAAMTTPAVPGGQRQEVDVVVAENGGQPLSHGGRKPARPAQDAERVRTAVDQIADQPQPIARRVEGQTLEPTPARRVNSSKP